jgi:hypothetical protein
VTSGHSNPAPTPDSEAEFTGTLLPVPGLSRNIEMDRASAERSLVSLVLTIAELLRQLMERQAIRRFDQGDLTDGQIEQIGSTLMALDKRMSELCHHFELDREDLNLDLGPLGPLLGRD